MIRRTLERRRAQHDAEAGMVLLFVIFAMTLVTMFVTAGLGYALQTQHQSRGYQDDNAAVAAAQAGVDDFISHLNRDDNYVRTSATAPFSDCANLAMRGPASPEHNSCGWSSTTVPGWMPVSSGDPQAAEFHYDVDATRLNATGVIELRSTGRANGESRTLEVTVARAGSTDYLYYTDHEDADPADKAQYEPATWPAGSTDICYSYWHGWAPDSPAGSAAPARRDFSGSPTCVEPSFTGGDVFDGKVHVNDTPKIQKNASTGTVPVFKQGLETADPACRSSVRGTTSTYASCYRFAGAPVLADHGDSWPRYAAPLYLPDNSGLFGSYPGCHYSGATRIVFIPGGKMMVWSKDSTGAEAECGGPAPNGDVVDVPDGEVIYVKDATTTARECLPGEIGDGLPLGTYSPTAQYRSGHTYTKDLTMLEPSKQCQRGNVYVQGELQGRVTVAAQASVVITGDLFYQGGLDGTDMLGLVAGSSVEVFHPIVATWTCLEESNGKPESRECTRWSDPTNTNNENLSYPERLEGRTSGLLVHAAIQALKHTFGVQEFYRGTDRGVLSVHGSIGQKWRGSVSRTYATSPPTFVGYLKDYRYDKRLKYSAPPYFPAFLDAVWSVRTTGEIPAQY